MTKKTFRSLIYVKEEKMNCDLHTHTVHSDGSLTPTELVREAKEKNLIIALTDHNTVSGLPEFMAEAQRQGVTAVGGTELSCIYGGREFHLIGLFIEPEYYDEVEKLDKEIRQSKFFSVIQDEYEKAYSQFKEKVSRE